nr:hypothetical protein [Tanacetum cinerariifolium]
MSNEIEGKCQLGFKQGHMGMLGRGCGKLMKSSPPSASIVIEEEKSTKPHMTDDAHPDTLVNATFEPTQGEPQSSPSGGLDGATTLPDGRDTTKTVETNLGTPMIGTHFFYYSPDVLGGAPTMDVLGGDTYDGYIFFITTRVFLEETPMMGVLQEPPTKKFKVMIDIPSLVPLNSIRPTLFDNMSFEQFSATLFGLGPSQYAPTAPLSKADKGKGIAQSTEEDAMKKIMPLI